MARRGSSAHSTTREPHKTTSGAGLGGPDYGLSPSNSFSAKITDASTPGSGLPTPGLGGAPCVMEGTPSGTGDGPVSQHQGPERDA